MLVYSPLDLAKNELRQAVVQNLPSGSPPSSPSKGQLWFDSTNNLLKWYDGTQWITAQPGSAATDATTTTKGIVQLAGDLTGTAASPQIAAGVITDAEVAAANKDGSVGTPSMRTLGYAASSAMPGNAVLSALNPPTFQVDMNNYKIVNLATPTAGTDAVTKNYVDNFAQGIDAKASVRLATTGNALRSGTIIVDSVQTVVGDRVLVKSQTAPAENGIYIVASGAWMRSTDMDLWGEVPGAFVFVEEGTTNADTGWLCTADAGGTINTTSMPWVQFSGAGQITAGAGLTKTGNTLDVGQGSGITVAADAIAANVDAVTIDFVGAGGSMAIKAPLPIAYGGTGGINTVAARNSLQVPACYTNGATHGAGTTISIPATTHLIGSGRAKVIQCRIEATGEQIVADNTVASNGDVTVTFAQSQAANTVRVNIVGW